MPCARRGRRTRSFVADKDARGRLPSVQPTESLQHGCATASFPSHPRLVTATWHTRRAPKRIRYCRHCRRKGWCRTSSDKIISNVGFVPSTDPRRCNERSTTLHPCINRLRHHEFSGLVQSRDSQMIPTPKVRSNFDSSATFGDGSRNYMGSTTLQSIFSF